MVDDTHQVGAMPAAAGEGGEGAEEEKEEEGDGGGQDDHTVDEEAILGDVRRSQQALEAAMRAEANMTEALKVTTTQVTRDKVAASLTGGCAGSRPPDPVSSRLTRAWCCSCPVSGVGPERSSPGVIRGLSHRPVAAGPAVAQDEAEAPDPA
jgi:hypothetical protein